MKHALLIVLTCLLVGCESKRYTPPAMPAVEPLVQLEPMSLDDALAQLDDRPRWDAFPPLDLPRHPAETYLKGLTIVLDPGHGGDAHLPGFKRGPTGVREAEINLRVALLLQKLLEDAGVQVVLTRNVDRDLSLADRAAVANKAKADLFLSLHHNASDTPTVNYTSIWVHGDLADAPPGFDAARHVAAGLGKYLRTDVDYTSPIMSDRQMYESGFGVLRGADVPAMLVEASFHSNPNEEQRLADARHNLREAYGIYEGLCNWALGGRPSQRVTIDNDSFAADLSTGLPGWWGDEFRGPLIASISVTIDGKRVPHLYDADSRRVTADVPADAEQIELFHLNTNGHANWPRIYDVKPDDPTTQPVTDAGQPWLKAGTAKLPFVLLDGGATATSQTTLDAFELPAGSALTIARVDRVGDVRALRWRDTGDVGFYPASTVKLATALMTLRQLRDLDADVLPEAWQVSLDGSPPANVMKLLRVMIADSDNEAFNTLQEVAGFAETSDFLKKIGCDTLTIRRHFTRPHWNYSRPAVLTRGDGTTVDIAARPAPDTPLNAAGGESNWSTTDDFVKLLAATFFTDARELPGFDVLAEAMRENNEPFIGRGLEPLGGFTTFGKPGWWPPDGNFVDAAYAYDAREDAHYLVSIYWQGGGGEDELQGARDGIAGVVRRVFTAIRAGEIRL